MAYVLKRYNGTSWVTAVKRYWDGTKWVGVDGAGDVAGPFDPLSIAWHTAFWVEGSEFIAQGYANTDPVTTVPDEAGTDDATTTVSGVTYAASVAALNSKPAMDGDGTGYLKTAAFTSTAAQPNTLVIVGSLSGSVTFGDGIASSARSMVYISGGTPSAWAMYAGTVVSGGTNNTNPHLFIGTFNGASSTLEVDGTTVIASNAGANSLTGITLFADQGGNIRNAGHLAFYALMDGTLTQQEKDDLLAWSRDHYGTP